jgi:Protein of unknown function (DUF2934)
MSERNVPTEEQIRTRAYELYLAHGYQEGHEAEDWLAAEKELTELSEQSASAAPKARAVGASN